MKKVLLIILGIFLFFPCIFAQEKEMNYPIICITASDKTEFCYIALEKLRLEHNAKGKDFREGKITELEWNEYLNKTFRPAQKLILDEILKQREAFKVSTKYTVNLNDLEKN